MMCTFCGTENPQGNRFCGMCGVRLERRKTERRTNRSQTTCSDCGHVNEQGHKFCGMCGVRIDRRTQERRAGDEAARATAMANAQLPTPDPRRGGLRREPEMARTSSATLAPPSPDDRGRQSGAGLRAEQPHVSTSVAGPSFLGLSDSSTEAEYLLEDEGSSHRGIRTLLLLIVLAAIVGLIFVQYRSSLRANPRSPEQPNPGPATVPRPDGKNRPLVKEKTLVAAVAARTLESGVNGLAKASAAPLDSGDDAVTKTNGGEQASAKLPGAKTPDAKPANAKSTNVKLSEQEQPPTSADTAPEANDKPSPALIKAQQYLHGQGVRQNCEQGLVYLKAATRENDPQAAVQMAALYSSGFCVTQDRVKAYQWFSSAREMEPDNRWIAKNLNQLWAQMTPQEKQQIHQ